MSARRREGGSEPERFLPDCDPPPEEREPVKLTREHWLVASIVLGLAALVILFLLP